MGEGVIRTRVSQKMIYAVGTDKPLFTSSIFEVMNMFILQNSARQLQKCWFLDNDKVDDSEGTFSTLKHSVK